MCWEQIPGGGGGLVPDGPRSERPIPAAAKRIDERLKGDECLKVQLVPITFRHSFKVNNELMFIQVLHRVSQDSSMLPSITDDSLPCVVIRQ